MYRPCYISGVIIDEEAESQTVLVSEREGKRRFPIGQMEALAIDRAVKGQVFPRPLTHDLLLVTIDALKADISEIRITDLKPPGPTFMAELVLTRGDGSVAEIDCRPSDAIALLVRRPATPFVVAENVLAEAAG